MGTPADRLPTLFGIFSLMSFATSIGMLIRPERTFKLFGVSNQKRSVASICYAASMLGEAMLQYLASAVPQGFMAAAIMYMVPYKLMSSLGLLWYSRYADDRGARREMRLLALQWFAPVVLIGGALYHTHDDYRKNYFSV